MRGGGRGFEGRSVRRLDVEVIDRPEVCDSVVLFPLSSHSHLLIFPCFSVHLTAISSPRPYDGQWTQLQAFTFDGLRTTSSSYTLRRLLSGPDTTWIIWTPDFSLSLSQSLANSWPTSPHSCMTPRPARVALSLRRVQGHSIDKLGHSLTSMRVDKKIINYNGRRTTLEVSTQKLLNTRPTPTVALSQVLGVETSDRPC